MYIIADSTHSLENTRYLAGFYRDRYGHVSQTWNGRVAYAAKFTSRAKAIHALDTLATCRVRYGRPAIFKVSL